MNTLFIRNAYFDWSRIPENDYLRDIHPVSGLDGIEFTKPVTFSSERTGPVSQRYLKHWLSHTASTLKAAAGITAFRPMILIQVFAKQQDWPEDRSNHAGDIS